MARAQRIAASIQRASIAALARIQRRSDALPARFPRNSSKAPVRFQHPPASLRETRRKENASDRNLALYGGRLQDQPGRQKNERATGKTPRKRQKAKPGEKETSRRFENPRSLLPGRKPATMIVVGREARRLVAGGRNTEERPCPSRNRPSISGSPRRSRIPKAAQCGHVPHAQRRGARDAEKAGA